MLPPAGPFQPDIERRPRVNRFWREPGKYLAIIGMVPKVFMAYQTWFWVGLVLNTIAMAILFFFWRAVYGSTESIAGLSLSTTLTYILLCQIFRPLTDIDLIFEFGYSLREGGILPMQPDCQWIESGVAPDRLCLTVFAPAKGTQTRFDLLEDDGLSLRYQQGEVACTPIVCTADADGLRIEVGPDGLIVEGFNP